MHLKNIKTYLKKIFFDNKTKFIVTSLEGRRTISKTHSFNNNNIEKQICIVTDSCRVHAIHLKENKMLRVKNVFFSSTHI